MATLLFRSLSIGFESLNGAGRWHDPSGAFPDVSMLKAPSGGTEAGAVRADLI